MNRAKDTISALKEDDGVVAKRTLSHFPKAFSYNKSSHRMPRKEREWGALPGEEMEAKKKRLGSGYLLRTRSAS